MIAEIIAGITVTGVFIGIGINTIFFQKPKELYPEICITEYYKLRWFDDE